MIPICTLLEGDNLHTLPNLAAGSVHCCITSPPYFGLRNYGLPPSTWPKITYCPGWGLPDVTVKPEKCCLGLESSPLAFIGHMVHVFREVRRVMRPDGTLWLNMGDSYASNGGSGLQGSNGQMADRGVAVNRGKRQVRGKGRWGGGDVPPAVNGIKPKDMMGMPWRLAMALQADGWFLRQEIIWNKPNTMPESTKDRCTKAHEHIFLLAPSARYFFDQEAIKEPASPDTNPRYARGRSEDHKWSDGGPGGQTIARSFEGMLAEVPAHDPQQKFPSGWDSTKGNGGHGNQHKNGREPRVCKYGALDGGQGDGAHRTKANLNRKPGVGPKAARDDPGSKQNSSFNASVLEVVGMRNKRSVWEVATFPCKDAHFATFPPDLIKPCIRAGTSAGGCCKACGAFFVRMIQVGDANLAHQKASGGDANGEYHEKGGGKNFEGTGAENARDVKARILRGMREKITVAWLPTCDCDGRGWTKGGIPRRPSRAEGRARRLKSRLPASVPCTVLDIYGGSGTTGEVSLEEGRNIILCEMSESYAAIARRRTTVTPGLPLS